MRVRELERLLTAQGVGAAKMDATTRKLRESGRLPKGGRGPNAPTIGAHDAAIILVAVAGSSKANEAGVRIEKLAPLRGGKAGLTLIDAVASCLTDLPRLEAISEIRVARTKRRAAVHFRDGQVEEYLPANSDKRSDRFYVEGILSAALIGLVARALRDGEPE